MGKHLSMEIRVPIDAENPSICREESLCIKCGQCRDVCTNEIGVHGTYSLLDTNDTAVCIHCGQCANVCPVDSITEKYEYQAVKEAVADPDKIVIFSTSPSVRAALGEEFHMPDGSFVQGKMVALLRKLGADYVLDTNFSADLTIMEEAGELIERIKNQAGPLPQFTSCCPAWVKYAEMYHPDILPHISSAKSPIGMQGPTIKTYFAEKMKLDPGKIVNVAVTPCTAKKYEIRREEMNAAGKHLGIPDMRDMDYVITTRELAKWAKEAGIAFAGLEEAEFDRLMGEASGAGVIFGNSGGVMEAALRTAYEALTGEPAPAEFYELTPVRGMEAVREASVDIGGFTVNAAVIYGTKNASEVIRRMKNGEKEWHFIEVMTCPGGCIGGGGQPKGTIEKGDALREERIGALYRRDRSMSLRKSHENSEIKKLYEEFYGKPLSELAEKMLHTGYEDKSRLLGGKGMAIYKCSVCGFIYDEEKEGKPFSELLQCPVCRQPVEKFVKIEEKEAHLNEKVNLKAETEKLSYDADLVRHDASCRYMEEIHEMAVTGQSIHGAMGTKMPMPGWDDVLILGAQLNPPPLDEDAYVNITTVIGKNAKRPMVLNGPVYISHMSFGALSKEIKTALSMGSAMAKTAMCSGEGGILPEEREAAYKYIFEYVPNKYSVTDENLRAADAIEIKIGQGTKPGMGGHLPGEKVTAEIAALRGKKQGEDVQSPSRFPELKTKEDLKEMVAMLRNRSDGRPVGIKIAAGRIERDLEYCVYAEPDFITIDGRGGATGSSPLLLREATSVPTIYALYRARKYLDSIHSDISLVITGGLRVSSDFAKAIAMGADAVAIASAALIAAACQQYRICGSGNCPVGIATQDPKLRERLKIETAAERVANFLNVSFAELKTFARITGHHDIHDLTVEDLVTVNREISEYTNIRHA